MKHSGTKAFATVVLSTLVALGNPLSVQAQPLLLQRHSQRKLWVHQHGNDPRRA